MVRTNFLVICVSAVLLTGSSILADCISDARPLAEEGDYRKVVLILDNCKEKPEAWGLLGKAYHELYEMEQAKKFLEKQVETNVDDLESRILLASALGYNKEFKKSIEKYRILHKDFPEHLEIQKGLARALGWNKEYEAALFLYRSVLKKDPADAESAYQVGVLLSWQKKFKEAVAELDKLIAAKPEKQWLIHAKLQRAEVYSWQKKFSESIAEYKSVLGLEQTSIEAYLGIGTVLEWQGKYKDARANYEKALTVDPQSVEVKNRLNQLMWVK